MINHLPSKKSLS